MQQLTYAQRQYKVSKRNGYRYSNSDYRLNGNNVGNSNNFGIPSASGRFRSRRRQLQNNPVGRRVRTKPYSNILNINIYES